MWGHRWDRQPCEGALRQDLVTICVSRTAVLECGLLSFQDSDVIRTSRRSASANVIDMSRLLERFRSEIVPSLKQQLGRTNDLAVPKLQKIIISMGVGSGTRDAKLIDQAEQALTMIAGQKPQRTRSRKSVAAFRLREGMEVGLRVTLRGQRMYEFMDRLVTLALPRVRDFRGLNPNGFDGHGNYSFGLTEQYVFPEIDPDKITQVQGMNLTFVTTARTNDEGRMLLREMGLPLRKE